MSTVSWLRPGEGRRWGLRGEALGAQLIRWATVAALVGAWEVLGRTSLEGNDYLTAPSRVVAAGLPAVLNHDTVSLVAHTTYRFLAAFAIVAVFGTAAGLLMGRLHRHLFLGGRDIMTVLYALPMAPFYPLFVLWLGLGDRSEIAFGVIHGIAPVILMTMTAAAAVEPNIIDSGRAMGAGRTQRLLHLIVPACLPDIVGALKIGAALSLLGMLLAELMISVNGVGTFISLQITSHQAAPLDAMVLVVCVGALVVNTVLSTVERRACHGRPSRP